MPLTDAQRLRRNERAIVNRLIRQARLNPVEALWASATASAVGLAEFRARMATLVAERQRAREREEGE